MSWVAVIVATDKNEQISDIKIRDNNTFVPNA